MGGAPELCPPQADDSHRDTPNRHTKTRRTTCSVCTLQVSRSPAGFGRFARASQVTRRLASPMPLRLDRSMSSTSRKNAQTPATEAIRTLRAELGEDLHKFAEVDI